MAYRPDRALVLLPQTTIATAVTGVVSGAATDILGMSVLTCQAIFLWGAGGTTVKAWVQTTIDGVTWFDVASFAFTTSASTLIHSMRAATAVTAAYVATDGTLADNTIKDGLLGRGVRVKYTSTGTYTGLTSLAVHAVVQGGS